MTRTPARPARDKFGLPLVQLKRDDAISVFNALQEAVSVWEWPGCDGPEPEDPFLYAAHLGAAMSIMATVVSATERATVRALEEQEGGAS